MFIKGVRLGTSTYLFTMGMVLIFLSVGLIRPSELAAVVEASRGLRISPAFAFTSMSLLMVIPTLAIGVIGLFFAAFQASIGVTALVAADNLLSAFLLAMIYIPYMALLGVVANEHLSIIVGKGGRKAHLSAYGESVLYLLALTVAYSYAFS